MNDGYMLCRAPNQREFYMAGRLMYSCLGYAPEVLPEGGLKGWKAIDYKEYPTWREMADDMEKNGIENIFAPFARDWG